ncbi:MAG: glycosyltransferase family 2 protein [Candidatus Thermoplasmatota archaeon]|nr:glycosyltransferase family 2 protein [Candidatus Thermoplasmatota archaeon]
MPESYSQQIRFYELRRSQKFDVRLSFICMFTGRDSLLEESIESIIDIAEETGLKYEILIMNNTFYGINPLAVEGIKKSSGELKIIQSAGMIRGAAKNEAFKNSTGNYIVFFNPEKVYEISYADLLYSFVRQREKRMLFSEIIVIPRDIIEENHGWKNLRVSEDLEFFTRISKNNGILFYPTEGRRTMDTFIQYKPSQIQKKKEYRRMGKVRKISILRDMTVGCNYGFRDLFLLGDTNERKHISERLMLIAAYLSSRTREPKVVKQDKNNYVRFMEVMFESIILGEYKRFDYFQKPLRISITEEENRYLSQRSEVWTKIRPSIKPFVDNKL